MTKSLKKSLTIIALIAAIAISATALVSCADKGTGSFTVTYVYGNGQENFVAEVINGGTAVEPVAPQRDGYEFLYWVKQGETTSYDFGLPINENVVLEAVWKEKTPEVLPAETVKLRWEAGEGADFLYDGTVPRNVKIGEKVSFGLRLSPCYVGVPKVTVGGEEIAAENGVYTFTVKSAATVRTSDLKRDNMTIKGSGTSKNPYVLANASQLKSFTDSINGGEKTYSEGYVVLDCDVDMNGFELEPIGTMTYQFKGVFDGQGHEIKNYTVNSEEGTVGFFGCIAKATVRNLRLSADITVETSKENNYLIGSVAGYCISGDIINCSFDGSIKVINSLSPDDYVVYVGGMSGFVQGYQTDYTGTVSYCSVNANISSEGTTTVYAMGGMVGVTHGSSEGTPAYLHNCSFNGEVKGKSIISGGIVGYLRDRSSVANSYASGSVRARSAADYAAAGAIVGVADNETAVSYCVSTAVTESVGASHDYEKTDLIGIIYPDGNNSIDSKKAVTFGSYYSQTGFIQVGDVDYDLSDVNDLEALIGWSDEWETIAGKIVPGYDDAAEKNITVTFDFGKDVTGPGVDGNPLTQSVDEVTVSDYGPVYWIYDGNGMNNFVADDGTVSYGYFFDAERTQRVPSATLVTQDMTIYVGFADYSYVQGEYYTVMGGKEITLTFDDNGKMTMKSGAMVANYVYVYDGNNILIRDGYFAYLDDFYSQFAGKVDLTTDYYAEKTSSGLSVYDSFFFKKGDVSKGEISCVAKNSAMGRWYDSDKSIYVFLAGGSGKKTTSDGAVSEFTYQCVGNNVVIRMGGSNVTCSISDSVMTDGASFVITALDAFAGKWETDFNTKKTVSFDGMGKAVYNGVVYDYTITEGTLTFGTASAKINDDGLLSLTDGGKETVFGREGSFMGVWKETYYDYWFRLDGITVDGYGVGVDSNGITFTYSAEETDGYLTVNMYYRTKLYGMFNLSVGDDGSEMLYLAAYNMTSGFLLDDYNMSYVDPYFGVWNASDGRTYDFNGFGAYDVNFSGASGVWIVEGYVTVIDGDKQTSVRYEYDKSTEKATFTYDSTLYEAVLKDGYIEVNGVVFKNPDEVSEYSYQADGVKLVYDGKSNVGIGKATLTADGETTIYDYIERDEGENLITELYLDSVLIYTVTFTTDGITVVGAGYNGRLGLYHVLVGKDYLVSGETYVGIDGTLDHTGKGKGHFGETEVDVYYVDSNYVSLYYGDSFLFYFGYQDENNAVLLDVYGDVAGIVTIPDGMEGRYVSAYGDELILDGRSNGSAYVYATAEMIFYGEEDVCDYVYKEENGEFYICEIVKTQDGDDLKKLFKIAFSDGEGAVRYQTEDGTKTIYVIPVEE
ncbi:MAG: InlB B-repeat-containing protein [Christensenellales bacterium]